MNLERTTSNGRRVAKKSWVSCSFLVCLGSGPCAFSQGTVETLFDLLELYTHHCTSTSVGPRFPADRFLTVRIPLNQEAEAQKLPRYTHWREKKAVAKEEKANGSRPGKRKAEPAERPATVTHPLAPFSANGEKPKFGRDGTVRFILDQDRADNEKRLVAEYFKVETEEYEVEE